jgi:hypothetical protein
MRPIPHAMNQRVFNRIDVTVLDVVGIVRFISDQMFPKAPLP